MKGRKRKLLKKGFHYCNKCHGNGKVKPHKVFSMRYFMGEKITNKCPKCDGKGQLDWIEKVIGVKKDHEVFNLPNIAKSMPLLKITKTKLIPVIRSIKMSFNYNDSIYK